MQFSFQDSSNLYLIIDYMSGGDLRYHIAKQRKFSEEQSSKVLRFTTVAEFFIACMLVCLEYLHNKSILHRDIKPENLVFDDSGMFSSDESHPSRLHADYRSWNRKGVEPWECQGHFWHARIHGSRGYVQTEPRRGCRLLRCRSHRLWMHVRKGKIELR